MSIFSKISEIESSSRKAVLCTVVKTKGSTPRKEGAKMLVMENGSIHGSIGGGSLEMEVIKNAQKIIKERQAKSFEHALVHDHGMCCGGSVTIFIEPIINNMNLYIFGAGHIGEALARFASQLDFSVTVIDERLEYIKNIPKAIKTSNTSHLVALEELEFNENTMIAVITHDHAWDREIVAYCAKKQHVYLGMIGSQRKVEMARKLFQEGNILNEEEMAKIDWPMGIDIRCETPEEIAISILARLIDLRVKINKLK